MVLRNWLMFVNKMSQEIKMIKLKIFGGLSSVNCYLIKMIKYLFLVTPGFQKVVINLKKDFKTRDAIQKKSKPHNN